MNRALLFARLVGLWIVAGGVLKLLLGTPGDLPPAIRDLPFSLGFTFKAVICVEIAVGLFAFLQPRVGWLSAALLLLVFDVVLATQIAAGATSCGCFGGTLEIPPWAMLAVDTVLLLALLLSRPWRLMADAEFHPLLLLGVVAVGVAAPLVLDRSAPSHGLPPWVVLDVESWRGKRIEETELARWVDVKKAPQDGLWVIWRVTCEDCADHLEHLALSEHGERPLTLVQMHEKKDDADPHAVKVLPQGPWVHRLDLPTLDSWVLTAPAELELKGGVIRRADEAVGHH